MEENLWEKSARLLLDQEGLILSLISSLKHDGTAESLKYFISGINACCKNIIIIL